MRNTIKKILSAIFLFLTAITFLNCTADAKSIFFGSYPFEADGRSRPVEWIVIKELPDGKMLATSRYAVEAMDFNDGPNNEITYENSTLRRWLNGYFLKTAFNEKERDRLIPMHVNPADNAVYKVNGGRPAKDKVFLFSAYEAEFFFPSKEERVLYPTPYAASKPLILSEKGSVNWWLRTVGRRDDDEPPLRKGCSNTGCMTRITFNGSIYMNGTIIYTEGNALYAVRPVILLGPEHKTDDNDKREKGVFSRTEPENYQLKRWKY